MPSLSSGPVDPRLLRSKLDVFVQLYRQKQQLSDQLAQLNQTLRLSDMLVAMLGHDLRSPLQSIDIASNLALQQADDPAAVRPDRVAFCSSIAKCTGHQSRLRFAARGGTRRWPS